MISMKNADDSVLFGMMNDPYAYFYGYKDVNGSVISGYNLNSNNLEGSEYTNAAGAYQNADEMNGTSTASKKFPERRLDLRHKTVEPFGSTPMKMV